MEDENDRIDFDNEDYFDHSGCGPIAASLLIIFLFWAIVGAICLFT